MKPPTTFIVSTCPEWPKWRVTDCPSTLERLRGTGLEFYDTKHHIWLECPVSCAHIVKTDSYLLLRRVGTICQDFEKQLSIATMPANSTGTGRVYMSSNIRPKLTKARELKRKGKERRVDPNESSEGEVEFVDSTSICLHVFLSLSALSLTTVQRIVRRSNKSTTIRITKRLYRNCFQSLCSHLCAFVMHLREG